jgi:GAF domain-containing protein
MVDRFQHLFDSLAEEVIVVDRNLQIVYANPAWIRRVGLPPSQVLGQRCHQVFLGASVPCAAETCAPHRVLTTGQPSRLRCKGLKAKLRGQEGELSASPVLDAAGRVTEVIQIVHRGTLSPTADQPPPRSDKENRQQAVAHALREVALIAGSSQGLQAVLDAILDQLCRVVDSDSASIVLMRDKGWQIIASRGFASGLNLSEVVFDPGDEKIAWMRRTSQPMVIADVRADRGWRHIPGTEFIRSWIGAPLLAHGRMIGTLNVDKAKPGAYQSEDAQLVMAFANQAAVVIDNARLLEAERQRVAHLSLISGISQHILSILDPEALLDYAVEAIQRRFGYYHVDVFLTDPTGAYQVFQASSHAEYASLWREQGMRFRVGEVGIIGHVAATGEVHVANDVRQDPRYVADELLSETRSELSVPIRAGTRVIGVLDLNSDRRDAFEDADLFVAQSLADQLALGLENARLYKAAQQRVAELEAVRQAGLSLTSSLELQAVLETILERTMDLLTGVQDAHMFLYHDGRLTFGAAMWADGRKGRPWSSPRPRGLTHTVAEQGQLVLVPDMRTHPLFADAPPEWAGAIVGLPLKIGQRVVGVMSVAYRKPRTWPETELRVLRMLADQAAIAIENAHLFEETRQNVARLEKKTRDLELVHQVSRLISSSLDLDHILETTVEQMVEVFAADHSGILLFDQDGHSGRIVAECPSSGAREEVIPVHGYQAAERIISEREPLIIEDVQNDPMMVAVREMMRRLDIRSMLIVPLIVKAEVIGSIGLDAIGQPRCFDDEEVALAQIIANQVAYAIENARLHAETQKRLQDQIALREAGTVISSALDLETVLSRIVEQIARAVDATSACICSLEPGQVAPTMLAKYFGPRARTQERDSDLAVTYAEKDSELLSMLQAGQHHTYHLDRLDLLESARVRMHQYGAQSVLFIPLRIKSQLLGFAELWESSRRREFTLEEIALCQGIAQQAAIALENAGLYQEMQQRLRELSLLFETSAAISTSLDPDMVLQTTAQQITAALGVEGCIISSWDRERDVLLTLLNYYDDLNRWEPQPAGTSYPLGDYPAARRVLTSRQPLTLQVSDPGADGAEVAWMVEESARSLLMVPLVVRDRVIGIAEFIECKSEREFSSTEINLCQTLANLAAAVWENARLFQETQARAREMTALAAVGRAMTTLELDDVLDSMAENALEAAQAQISSVYLVDESQKRLVPRSVRGMAQEELEKAYFDLGEGTIGLVAESGQALIVHDIASTPAWVLKCEASRQIRNTLTVPLAVKGRVIGTLEVCNKVGTGGFTSADQRLLTAFASQAAIAIDNARLYQEVSQHLEDALILNKVAGAATSTLDFDQVIRRGLEVLVGVRNFERVRVMLLDEASGELWLHPALAGSELAVGRPGFRIPLGDGITGWVAQTGKPLRIADVRHEPRYLSGFADTLSELCVPLRVGDRIIGVLDTQSPRLDAFTESDERLLTTLSGQLSTVIENSRLFAEARQRVRELTAVMQVSQALNEAKDLQTTLDAVLEEAFALLGSQEGSIILIDPLGSNRLAIVAERGLGPEVVEAFNSRPVYTHEGTYKRALRSGRIVEVDDTAADADFLHDVGSRAKVVTNVPLTTERGAIGLIALDGLPQDETTRRLLAALADMAAVAIEKERLHQYTADRLSEVSTLYTLSTQIASSLSLTSVLDSIVTILKLTLDCRACSIFLLNPSGEYLQLEAASGPSSAWKGVARLQVGEAISGRVITERRSIYVPDTTLEPDFLFFDPGIRSLLVVPLVIRDRAVGTLSIDDTEPNAFDEEVRLLTIAAAQAAVAIENAQLYESLQGSYRDLERAYEELRQLDKMKSELVQNVSHELRTPLTFIKGYVELLQDGEMGELLEGQSMALEIVANKAEVLARLVDDVISMQQAGREQLHFESLCLADIGHAAVRAALASASEAGITLRDEIPDVLPLVVGDRQRLGQVLDNLLQNAIKFSHAGDTISVRMCTEEKNVRAEVQDTGIGIPADQLGRIFDRFYQVDGTTTRRFGGTGLGLAIVKQLVEGHGGHVGVRSQVGEGSLFYFTIPIAKTAQTRGGQ